MKRYVFDSYAILAFWEDEPGADIVEKALREVLDRKAVGLLSVINWGEIFYSTTRVLGEAAADQVISRLVEYPIDVVDADLKLTRDAARLKAKYPVAYADCFAAALAKKNKAVLLTGDPEFRLLEKEVKILWLR